MTSTETTRNKQSGFGVIELMSTMAIFAILAAAGLTNFDTARTDINTSTRRLNADLRFARARSMATGDHFAIHQTSATSYQIERREWTGSAWSLKRVVRVENLPAHLSMAMPSGVDSIEFDSRGELTFAPGTPTAPIEPTLTDSKFNAIRNTKVWPSGQILTIES